MFEVMDSYIEVEEGNTNEAKWMRDLASTILRLFESLYDDDETLFHNVVKSKKVEYATIRDTVDAIKRGEIDKAELDSIGSHNTVSDEDEGNDSDFEDVDSLEDVKEEDGDSGSDDKEEVKSLKKKKKKTNQGFVGLNSEAQNPEETAQNPSGADDMMANILAGINSQSENNTKRKGKKK